MGGQSLPYAGQCPGPAPRNRVRASELIGRGTVGRGVEVDVEGRRIRPGDGIGDVKVVRTVVGKESIATCAAVTLTVNGSEAETPAEFVTVRTCPCSGISAGVA